MSINEDPGTPPVAADPVTPRVRLWNPQAAVGWSVLFSPIFGSLVHARNWTALGNLRMAQANYFWAAGVSCFLLAYFFAPGINIPTQLNAPIAIAILMAWLFSVGKRQVDEVNTLGPAPQGYEKKSWALPLGISVAVIGLFIAVFVFMWNRAVSPDAIAAQLKPEVEKAWKKSPDVKEAHVDSIKFGSVKDLHYQGTVTGNINGEPISQPISVTVNSNGQIVWKIGE